MRWYLDGRSGREAHEAGHIPGAQCAVFTDNLDATGCFLPAAQLRARFDALRGTRPVESLVAYCGSGVTACHNLFAMSLAGYPLAPLYAGSWSEYYGIQGMTWKNPPILDDPDRVRDVDGRKLELFYDGSRIRLVAWRTSKAVYWVTNTLTLSIPNSRLVAIASSLRRLK